MLEADYTASDYCQYSYDAIYRYPTHSLEIAPALIGVSLSESHTDKMYSWPYIYLFVCLYWTVLCIPKIQMITIKRNALQYHQRHFKVLQFERQCAISMNPSPRQQTTSEHSDQQQRLQQRIPTRRKTISAEGAPDGSQKATNSIGVFRTMTSKTAAKETNWRWKAMETKEKRQVKREQVHVNFKTLS